MLPSEWLETNVASTDFKKESTESFDEEARQGYEVEESKYFDEEKEFGDRELQSQNTKKIEEKQRRETLMLVDIESKEPRRLQEENRGKFLKRNGGSEDEEVEFRSEQNELAVCTQEKNRLLRSLVTWGFVSSRRRWSQYERDNPVKDLLQKA